MIELITANLGDISRIQKIFDDSPTYFLNISGKKAPPDAANKTFETFPHKKTKEDKLVLIVRADGEDIGVVDLIHAYPDSETAFLGLLLLSEKVHRTGLGRTTYLEVEKVVQEVGLKKIRLAATETNPVVPFWEKMGFHLTGEKKEYRNKKVHSVSLLMEKEI